MIKVLIDCNEGHADVVMGAIATNNEDIYERLKYLQNCWYI